MVDSMIFRPARNTHLERAFEHVVGNDEAKEWVKLNMVLPSLNPALCGLAPRRAALIAP